MQDRAALFRSAAAVGMTLLLLAACDQPIAAPTESGTAASSVSFDRGGIAGSAEANAELAQLRQVTAQLRDTLAAKQAGWTVQVTNCMDDLPAGAMGFHFGNPAYIGDVTPDARRPQLLMYEPTMNGGTRLVGVEYIIPYGVLPANTTPKPTLFGQPFENNDAFGIWALHAWVWKENPNGMFFDWNPNVTCQYAGDNVTHLGAS